ncbi:hypothetical protein CHS0354_038053 [Potamilus streckersoni]|uniref:Uncharacterized protein n=1 Tax=Potamilus streckersoni TaxID=2493646 RepID=A0AAE0W0Z5_9BIVA|nr:hypothetical protein CHS0354_038053 [Potamilus streckersoni]
MFINFNSLYRRSAVYTGKGLMRLSGSSSAPSFDTKTTMRNQPLGIHPTNPRYLRQMFHQSFISIQDGTLVWQKYPSDQFFYNTTGLFLTLLFAYAVYRMCLKSSPKKKGH